MPLTAPRSPHTARRYSEARTRPQPPRSPNTPSTPEQSRAHQLSPPSYRRLLTPHATRTDAPPTQELKMRLESETWQCLPLPRGWKVSHLKELKDNWRGEARLQVIMPPLPPFQLLLPLPVGAYAPPSSHPYGCLCPSPRLDAYVCSVTPFSTSFPTHHHPTPPRHRRRRRRLLRRTSMPPRRRRCRQTTRRRRRSLPPWTPTRLRSHRRRWRSLSRPPPPRRSPCLRPPRRPARPPTWGQRRCSAARRSM